MDACSDRRLLAGMAGCGAVRIGLGLLLLVAAALKGHQLATGPVAGSGLLDSRWLLLGVVEFELAFGLWLLSGLFPEWSWRAAVVCFAGFGCASLWKGLGGEATCGCFGRVPVNPWYTFLLDVLAVTALLLWRPSPGRQVRPMPAVAARVRVAAVAGVFLLVGTAAAVATASFRPATVDEVGGISGNSQLVVLEPEKWIGQRFPLLPYIDIGEQLVEGEWIVVLYHYDCPKCQDVIAEYEQLSCASACGLGSVRIALVEMPPYGTQQDLPHSGVHLARLDRVKEWFATTPLRVSLNEGIVVEVTSSERSGDPGRALDATSGAGFRPSTGRDPRILIDEGRLVLPEAGPAATDEARSNRRWRVSSGRRGGEHGHPA